MKAIYKKILEAQKAIKHVAKNGRNSAQNYDFVTEADVLDQVKSAANEAGLVVLTSANSETGDFTTKDKYGNERLVRFAKVTLTYTVADPESGEAITGSFDGYAEDSGDKAIYKATTGANKYFLMKFFGVPTGDDPEKDAPETPKPTKINGSRMIEGNSGGMVLAPEAQASINECMNTFDNFCKLAKLNKKQIALLFNGGTPVPSYPSEERAASLLEAVTDFIERKESGNLEDRELKIIGAEAA